MTSDEDSFWPLSPTATVASGLLHAIVLLAIASQAVISELSPWRPRSDRVENVPVVEFTIVRPEPKPPPPPPPTASLPGEPDRIPITAPERPPPPPPLALPDGANFTSALPLPEPSPPVAPPPAPSKPAAQQTAPSPAAKPQPQPVAQQYRSREDYLLQVIRTLARSPYIPRIRLDAAPGVVVTRLTVSRDGHLLEAELTRSSGYAELDNAMMEAIHRAGPFPPPPVEAGPNGVSASAGDRYTLTVPIRFRPLDSSRPR